MAAKNVVLEKEEELKPTGLPDEETVLLTEAQLIEGLLEAAGFETDEDLKQPVEIRRKGKLLFNFNIRPLSEKEMMRIRKLATTKKKNPAGKHLPPIEDLNIGEFRSRRIYEATCEEDKAKLWDNPKVKAGLNAQGKNILESWEIIDAVLIAGEKLKISELIDKISGYSDDDEDEEVTLEEYAKN